jgi:hypothetical protein
MKFCDFWIEVPSAFLKLVENKNYLNEEITKYDLISKTFKVKMLLKKL